MNAWMMLWKVLLVASLSFFGLMAVLVTIGGGFDVKRMLTRVEESHRRTEE